MSSHFRTIFTVITLLQIIIPLFCQDPTDISASIAAAVDPSITPDASLTNSNLAIDVVTQYEIDGQTYTFDTLQFYIYQDGQYVISPFIKYTVCDSNNRPTQCYDTDAPVCGYVTTCPDGKCVKDLPNDCQACLDPTITWYINGTCDQVRNQCAGFDTSIACTNEYTPVCAVANGCSGSYCSVTVANGCLACNLPYIKYFVGGECPNVTIASNLTDAAPNVVINTNPGVTTGEIEIESNNEEEEEYEADIASTVNINGEAVSINVGSTTATAVEEDELESESENESEFEDDRIFCDPENRPSLCNLILGVVCAHQQDCNAEICTFTSGNACTACNNATVDYYTDGQCYQDYVSLAPTDVNSTNKVLCDPNNRPLSCPLNYQPVCTYAINCEGDGCSGTMMNPCVACSVINANYYVNGECQTTIVM